MQPSAQLTTPAIPWEAKQRYRVKQVVIHNGAYWSNATGINSTPSTSNTDWVYFGLLEPGSSETSGRLNKYIKITTSGDGFQDNDLVGAIQVSAIITSVAGVTMKDAIDFNSAGGEVLNFPVIVDDELLVFYTQP